MNIIIAIDSFKGCLSSALANQSAADGVLSVSADVKVVQMPVSDGGEGWLSAYHAAIGGELITKTVRDPLMRWIEAQYLVKDQTAVVEIAQASGLPLLTAEERNPMVATSYGTGQLIVDAVRRGCKEIIVGLGGSATSDCGKGMLRAIIDAFAQQGTWDDITELQDVRFTIATDVTNPLCGPEGAAHVFAPQKGATPANMNAGCRSGIELLLEAVGFESLLQDASLVITGEGSADRQTLMGKLPFGILQSAKRHQVPVALIAGRIGDRQQLLDAGFAHVECINPPGLSLEEAIQPSVAQQNIKTTVQRLLK